MKHSLATKEQEKTSRRSRLSLRCALARKVVALRQRLTSKTPPPEIPSLSPRQPFFLAPGHQRARRLQALARLLRKEILLRLAAPFFRLSLVKTCRSVSYSMIALLSDRSRANQSRSDRACVLARRSKRTGQPFPNVILLRMACLAVRVLPLRDRVQVLHRLAALGVLGGCYNALHV